MIASMMRTLDSLTSLTLASLTLASLTLASLTLGSLVLLAACSRATSTEVREERPTQNAPPPSLPEAEKEDSAAASTAAPRPDPAGPPDLTPYPWHQDPSIDALPAEDVLSRRFEPPVGYTRVGLPKGSFGAWLRELPLAEAGTPVRSYDGALLLPADHDNVAAVTTLDIGKADLQQCADAVMRLHAEWLWHSGRASEASYASGGGAIAWQRYRDGWTPQPQGNKFVWTKTSRGRADDHASYRRYLDQVFSWSNTVALRQHSQEVDKSELRPGDFFILPGSPGHTVLVLDVARAPDGRTAALLGQSYMPAQSFQVLRPSPRQSWFALDDDNGIKTPFWPRFPWSSLRRLDG
jgi:hypothetical protein